MSGPFDKPHPSFSFGATLSLVSLDPETGRVITATARRAARCQPRYQPSAPRRAAAGGAAQGVAGALFEELPYDESGQPLALSLADYLLPTLLEAPPVDVVLIDARCPATLSA